MIKTKLLCIAVLVFVFHGQVHAGGGVIDCQWEWVNPLPQGDRISSLVWGDAEYLGIAESGLVQTSTDGKSWKIVAELEEPDNFVKIRWDGSQYLALASGTGGASSRLYVSPNGSDWTNALIGLGFLNDFATDGSRVVIVGNNNSIYYSDDLTTFTRISSFAGSWVAVAWTGNQFVALRDENNVLTSPDGENWTLFETGISGKFSTMAIVGARLVAAGFQGATMTSTDGVNWEAGNSGVTGQLRVYVDDTQFILTGPSNPLVSVNGVDWTTTSGSLGFALAFAYSGSNYAAFKNTGWPQFSTDLTSWEDTAEVLTSSNLNVIANNDTIIVVAGEGGTIGVSTDGFDWDIANRLSSVTINDLEWDGNQFVLVGNSGAFATSVDGQSWDRIDTPGGAQLLGVVSNGVGYVAVGNQGALLSSADGVTWIERNSETAERLNAVASSGIEYIAVGRNGTILRSTDSVTWASIDSGTTRELYDVKFAAGQYVAVGLLGTILTSSDGLVWELQTTPSLKTLLDLHWAFGQYVAVGEATILVSPDGANWTEDRTFNTVAALAATTLPESAVAVGRYGSIQFGSCPLFKDGFEK
ncbi:MAG: hypothetical protein KJO92_07905 [Gammaproteobacteria bacterium]|nr:hypothetical protein [Gammaproteobacteria bacterium]